MTLLLGACGPSGSGTGTLDQGIRGVVLLGPVCPIESIESPCPPRRLADARVEISNAHGEVVATARTDGQGRFEVRLSAGTYTVVAVPASPGPGGPTRMQAIVRSHRFTQVTVPVDSGIRAPASS